jgi:hypothetical protein
LAIGWLRLAWTLVDLVDLIPTVVSRVASEPSISCAWRDLQFVAARGASWAAKVSANRRF